MKARGEEAIGACYCPLRALPISISISIRISTKLTQTNNALLGSKSSLLFSVPQLGTFNFNPKSDRFRFTFWDFPQMGCYVSKDADSKANRLTRWRSTGIVALRDSKLKTFPDEVFDLEGSVRTLDLTHNKIVDIPLEISKLINMQRLVLANNLIERLPVNLGKLQSLKIMTLDGNRVTSLPDELGQLVRLERLSISGNTLTCLPDTIGSLRNLVLINVSNNKLKSLPESIGSCFSLEELQADNNLIEDLPSSVCNLSHLKSLSLNNNNVKQIPQNLLKDCKALQNISLHENPISMDQFQQMEGFQEFEGRRKKKFDKQIDSNVMISSKGLDEGVDL